MDYSVNRCTIDHQRLLQRTVLVAHVAILGPTVEARKFRFRQHKQKREGEFVFVRHGPSPVSRQNSSAAKKSVVLIVRGLKAV